ncbi:hypothetical protein L4174_023805 (plasmid) [Photobacterium sp. CCB-ST2H9]|uniref:hypothetical protein n=1 Tax=Photobacterium sp. CCB-ST2H9 TaxID=2912855 RepID=UPI002006AD62|nr:hypothetical protein [Photobacterium sp. CCB-ST2H9]UTM60412.1 hypothetical protein L4174_023805 [Photobacterium sp. CCB-ST2H9]
MFSLGNIFNIGNTALHDALKDGRNALGFSSQPVNPYMQQAKKYVKKLVETPFQQGWQWTIEADDSPDDFEIYVKDIDFSLGSIDADVTNVGSGSIGKVVSSSAGEVTMTVRDNQDGRVKKWFQKLLKKVKNDNGTVNLPKDYVFSLRVYSVNDAGDKTLYETIRVFAVKANINLTRDEPGNFISYPIIFQKFSTLGNKQL